MQQVQYYGRMPFQKQQVYNTIYITCVDLSVQRLNLVPDSHQHKLYAGLDVSVWNGFERQGKDFF